MQTEEMIHPQEEKPSPGHGSSLNRCGKLQSHSLADIAQIGEEIALQSRALKWKVE